MHFEGANLGDDNLAKQETSITIFLPLPSFGVGLDWDVNVGAKALKFVPDKLYCSPTSLEFIPIFPL